MLCLGCFWHLCIEGMTWRIVISTHFFLNIVTYCVLGVVVLLKHSRKTYRICLRFGSRAGSVTNSAVVHAKVAMTVSSPTGTAVLRRNWALPLV